MRWQPEDLTGKRKAKLGAPLRRAIRAARSLLGYQLGRVVTHETNATIAAVTSKGIATKPEMLSCYAELADVINVVQSKLARENAKTITLSPKRTINLQGEI